MIHICAWCQEERPDVVQLIPPYFSPGKPCMSHGMCKEHSDREKAKLRAMMEDDK